VRNFKNKGAKVLKIAVDWKYLKIAIAWDDNTIKILNLKKG